MNSETRNPKSDNRERRLAAGLARSDTMQFPTSWRPARMIPFGPRPSAFGILLLLLFAALPVLAAGPRPNLVVLIADDLRFDAVGYAGNTVVRTPHLDRLAATGTVFRNAFVTTSICCVSRANILTGQHARRNGVHDFATPLKDFRETYPGLLQSAGYYTGFIGKWGIKDLDRAYHQQAAGWFDYWAGDTWQTRYWHSRACNYVTNNGTTDRTNFFCTCPNDAQWREGVGHRGPHPSLVEPIHTETQVFPDKYRSFLDQRDPAKPFCLTVAYKAPHSPFAGFDTRFANEFAGVPMPLRANVAVESAERQPEFLRRSLENPRGLELVRDTGLDGQLQNWLRDYYRLILGMDESIGALVHELELRGLATNTVILFISDNGHFAAEHGFFGKWLMHEESIRVPLLLHDPRLSKRRQGQASDAMVLSIDVAPTLLELAGLRPPTAMQGRSLLPLLARPNRAWRDSFYYQHQFSNPTDPRRRIVPSEGLRTRDWKYIRYPEQSPVVEQLFDLKRDPLELRDLAADPAHRRQLERLRQQWALARAAAE